MLSDIWHCCGGFFSSFVRVFKKDSVSGIMKDYVMWSYASAEYNDCGDVYVCRDQGLE